MPPHGPGYNALRRGRYSAAGLEYFLTLTLKRPARGLESEPAIRSIQSECARLEEESLWRIRIATIMPDHLHLVVTLGSGNSLSSAVRLLKGRLTPVLRGLGVSWQPGYYDHQIRPTDDRLPIFLYVYLNPYRAGLVASDEVWPGFWCRPEDWKWVRERTAEGCPFPEWLQ